jgi:hypothetical protein
LIPRIKFAVSEDFHIKDFWNIDVTLATSHFHDVVISKEGQSEGQPQLLKVKYGNEALEINQDKVFSKCAISMPTDQKRNMMNASSNMDIIRSILLSLRSSNVQKVHSPGVEGEIGGYPYVLDGSQAEVQSYFDESVFSMEQMRDANRKSIALDGIENVTDGCLIYTDALLSKIKNVFKVDLPKVVKFEEINFVSELLIEQIIKKN